MSDRLSRLKEIKRIIKNEHIESQEDLATHLRELDIVVTQATLSRDLKILKVSKVFDDKGTYYYSLPGEAEIRESELNFIQDFMRGYISIDYSGNLVVIKTLMGHSDPVALAIENLGTEEVLGTISGETTVFVALREGYTGDMFFDHMKNLIPELEV